MNICGDDTCRDPDCPGTNRHPMIPTLVTDHQFIGLRQWGINPPGDRPCQKRFNESPTGGHDGICGVPKARHHFQSACGSGLSIKGENFPCDVAAPHDGWAHGNAKAEAIWGEGNVSVDFMRYRRAVAGQSEALAFNTTPDPAIPLVDFFRWLKRCELYKDRGVESIPQIVAAYLAEKGNDDG